jgi:hypothetical protein
MHAEMYFQAFGSIPKTLVLREPSTFIRHDLIVPGERDIYRLSLVLEEFPRQVSRWQRQMLRKSR